MAGRPGPAAGAAAATITGRRPHERDGGRPSPARRAASAPRPHRLPIDGRWRACRPKRAAETSSHWPDPRHVGSVERTANELGRGVFNLCFRVDGCTHRAVAWRGNAARDAPPLGRGADQTSRQTSSTADRSGRPRAWRGRAGFLSRRAGRLFSCPTGTPARGGGGGPMARPRSCVGRRVSTGMRAPPGGRRSRRGFRCRESESLTDRGALPHVVLCRGSRIGRRSAWCFAQFHPPPFQIECPNLQESTTKEDATGRPKVQSISPEPHR